MYLADLHCHSSCSTDGQNSIVELAQAALTAGLKELCVTDHCDCNGKDECTFRRSRDKVLAMLTEARAIYGDRLRLPYGIELGQALEFPEVAGKELGYGDYDFVVGSLHNMRGTPDFFFLEYPGEAECHTYLERYFAELLETAERADFDTLAHISYPLRYMAERAGIRISLRTYEEELRTIFRALAQRGKALELNTSFFRQKNGEGIVTPWEYQLFHEMGGENVTVGSDAHRAEDIGKGIQEGLAILSAAGFEYISLYEKRKPRHEKI